MDVFFIERLLTMFIETFFTIATGLVVTGKGEWNFKLFIKLTFICWILNSSVILGFDLFKIPLGVHTLIISAILVFVLRLVGKYSWFRSVVSTLISYVLLFLGEGLILFNFLRLNNLTFEDLFVKLGGRLFGQLVTDSLMIILIMVILGGKYIYGLKSTDKGARNQ